MGALTDLVASRRVRPVQALAGGLEMLRQQMTPGQRWTAGLAATTALALLLYGQPTLRVAVPAASGDAATTSAPATSPVTAAPSAPVEADPAPPESPSAPGPTRAVPPPAAAPLAEDPPSDSATTPPTVATVPLFTALVPTAPTGTVPGRDEASIASAFLASASVNGVVLDYDPAATDLTTTCDLAAERRAVLAASPLPHDLRACLAAREVVVLAHDEAAFDGETLETFVRTRPIARDAILSAAGVGRGGDGLLTGRVGLAVAPRLQGDAEVVLPELEAAGVDVVAVAYVTSVRESVLAFAQAGVETTVFALPVSQQREWVSLAQLASPTMSYVATDAADAVTSGGPYAPAFEGARYVGTALPTDTPTPAQEDCLDRYGSPPLDDAERGSVLRWCQLVDVAGAAADRTRTEGLRFPAALRTLTFDSPLTTPLTPDEELGTWGPSELHELVWKGSCACWRPPAEVTPSTQSDTPGPGAATPGGPLP